MATPPDAVSAGGGPDGGTGESTSEPAPAKINLYLHIIGKLPNGYHRLDSLVVFARLGDTIRVSPATAGSGIRLACDGPFADQLGPTGENLVWRAAEALAARRGRADIDIRLTKRLPVASGMGGGSADAAAAIRALARLWKLDVPPDFLWEVALGLGADVPMCLGCRTRPACQVGGIGDAVSAAPPLPRFHLLLANPGVARPTPAVYAARKGAFSEAQPVIDPGSTAALFAERLAERSNDLARAAESLSPAIGDVRRAIAGTSGCLLARMSGSGATCFGIFATATEAEAAAGRLRTAHPDWWIRTTAVLQGPPVAGTTEAG